MDGSEKKLSTSEDVITYIFPDFSAVNYFQKDFVATNEFHSVEETVVSGIDIYLVEQWYNQRKISTIISNFTGNPKTKIATVRFTVIKKPSRFYPLKFQEYLNELMLNNANVKRMEKTTSSHKNSIVGNEVLFVTSITSLPSNLNLLNIESGDARSVLDDFVINSNLKKMHCGGRSMSLFTQTLSLGTEEKFRNLYRITNPKVPMRFAVKEIVNLIQICLFYFDLLDAKYCDGFLCNRTEDAISSWWNLIGLPHFSMKPNFKSGAVSQRSVAGIFSFLISVKVRLQLIGGCDVPKDPFDFENFMISVGQFQKQYRLEKRRKLDLETLNRLFSVTNASLLPDQGTVYNSQSSLRPNQSTSMLNNYDDDTFTDTGGFNGGGGFSPNPSTMSSYRKSKNYYSKEIKKLTNVVKTTVQDHINAVNRADEMSNTKSSVIRRGKHSKFSEFNPLDVETLDIEMLVNNFLVGRRLLRLFYGNTVTDSYSPQKLRTSLNRSYSQNLNGRNSERNGNGLANIESNKNYQFVSLKDEISSASSAMTRNDYPKKGFNRMKLGRSGRRNNTSESSPKDETRIQLPILSTPPPRDEPNISAQQTSTPLNSNTLVDALLQIDDTKEVQSNGESHKIITECSEVPNSFERFYYSLNRRNSFPFIPKKGEVNLNLINYKKNKHSPTYAVYSDCCRRRSSSFSAVEEYVLRTDSKQIGTITNVASSYLQLVCKMDHLNYERQEISDTIESEAKMYYNQLNMELVRVKNVDSKTKLLRAKIDDEDSNLEFKMKDLSGVIDRLRYETKIVYKRIIELEGNTVSLEETLAEKCTQKLNKYVEDLTTLELFYETYSDKEEREAVIFQLTGKKVDPSSNLNQESKAIDPNLECNSIFQFFVFCIYEFLFWLLQLIKFDRRKMNLDRIRHAWAKLDPNRQYIEQTYAFLGRKPSNAGLEGQQM